jgi:hypothetical protein
VRVAAPTPGTARITLSAPAFADFGATEPGEIITLGWAAPGEELVLPRRGWRFPTGTRTYKRLRAVREGRLVRIADPDLAIALSYSSLLSLPYQLREIVPRLKAALAA